MSAMNLNQAHNRAEDLENRYYSNILRLAWPASLEGALLSIISSVDTVMVKAVGENAIASVSLTVQPRMILLIIAQALCVGTTALIARRKGENDRESANAVLSQSMLIISAIGIVITLCGCLLAEPIMILSGANEDTLALSVDYFRIISMGLIPNCWNLCLCAALRATGNTRITMVTNITANLVNVFFNYCLISGRLGFRAMGVKGAAIATDIGTVIACLISLVYVLRKGGYLRLSFRKFSFDRRTLSGLLKVGSSSVAESAFLRIGFFINTRMIADLGTIPLTAYTIVQQVTSLSFTVGDGIATAGATMIGLSLGENRKDKASAYVRTCRVISLFASVLLMAIIFFLRNTLAGIFSDDSVVIAGASAAFIAAIVGMIPQNARVVYSGCLRGAGDVKYVAICCMISVTLIRPFFTWLCCYPINSAFPDLLFVYTGPWIAFLIDAIVRQILLFLRIKKGKWLNIAL